MAQLFQCSRATISLVETGRRMLNGKAQEKLGFFLNALHNTNLRRTEIAKTWEGERKRVYLPVIAADIARLESEAHLYELQLAEMRKANLRLQEVSGKIDAMDFGSSGVFQPDELFWKDILLSRQRSAMEENDYLKQLRVHSKIKSLRAEARALREGAENWESFIGRMSQDRS